MKILALRKTLNIIKNIKTIMNMEKDNLFEEFVKDRNLSKNTHESYLSTLKNILHIQIKH